MSICKNRMPCVDVLYDDTIFVSFPAVCPIFSPSPPSPYSNPPPSPLLLLSQHLPLLLCHTFPPFAILATLLTPVPSDLRSPHCSYFCNSGIGSISYQHMCVPPFRETSPASAILISLAQMSDNPLSVNCLLSDQQQISKYVSVSSSVLMLL